MNHGVSRTTPDDQGLTRLHNMISSVGSDPDPRQSRGQYCAPIGGQLCVPIDIRRFSSSMAFCAFRELWALISRDLGHAFHAIVGSHFADAGRLADGFIESGLIGSVKRFRDVSPASEAFS